MNIFEVSKDELSTALYDPAEDKLTRRRRNDTRKPVLTLRHLNRLKKLRAMKKLEQLQNQDLLGIMYGQQEETGGMGMNF